MEVDNKKIARNSLWLYLRMLLVTLVSLYTSRIVLKALGADDYGIYNVAGGVISFIAMLTSVMANSTQRYLNILKGKGDYDGLSRMMNISITLHILIGIGFIFIGETIGLYVVAFLLEFPENRYIAALSVYQSSLFALVFSVLKTPYTSLVITYERFSFLALLSLVDVVAKLGIAFGLLYVNVDSLVFYGFSFVFVESFLYIIYRFYTRKLFYGKAVRINEMFHSSESKSLIKFSMWGLLGNAGNTFANQGITVMLNFFFPLSVNAAMGITNQVTNSLSTFINNVQLAFRPQLLQSYASHNGSFTQIICDSAKWSFVLMMFVCVPLACNLHLILELWLGSVPYYTYHFIMVLMGFLIIDTLSTPLYYGLEATGEISNYQLSSFIIMFLNVFAAWVVCVMGFAPPIVIFTKLLANMFIISLRLYCLCKKSVEFSLCEFFNRSIRPIVAILPYASIIILVSFFVEIVNRILLTTVVYFLGLLPILYLFSMNNKEKKYLRQILNKMVGLKLD